MFSHPGSCTLTSFLVAAAHVRLPLVELLLTVYVEPQYFKVYQNCHNLVGTLLLERLARSKREGLAPLGQGRLAHLLCTLPTKTSKPHSSKHVL